MNRNLTNSSEISVLRIGSDNVWVNFDFIDIGPVTNNATAITEISIKLGNGIQLGYVPDAIVTPFSSLATQAIAVGISQSSNPSILMIGAGIHR